ncbi:MAG: PadR family transcriptional regulator [Anaerolineales bacterium]|nr:PadR family transcriptional regulator [Anaerolineales bacterium]
MLPHTLLALLSRRPMHGYDLKHTLEQALGGNREINFGQIYTTLSRLERDAWVEVAERSKDGRGKKTYQITPSGRQELARWLAEVAEKPTPLNDAFFSKLLVQKAAGESSPRPMIARQRQAYLQQLRALAELAADPSLDPITRLLADGATLHLQADLHWLDLCEERLAPPEND